MVRRGHRAPAADHGRRPRRAGDPAVLVAGVRADRAPTSAGCRQARPGRDASPTPGPSSQTPRGDAASARPLSAGPSRTASGRRRARQPHRRAHRLQRRVRAAVRPAAASPSSAARRGCDGPAGGCARQRLGAASFAVDGLAPGAVTGWAAYVGRGGVGAARRRARRAGRRPVDRLRRAAAARGCPRRPRWNARCSARWSTWAGSGLSGGSGRRWRSGPRTPTSACRAGVMDQLASMLCQAGHALFLDCRSLATEQVPFDVAAPAWPCSSSTRARRTSSSTARTRARRDVLRARPPRLLGVPRAAGRARRPSWRGAWPASTRTSCAAGSGTWSPRTTGCCDTVDGCCARVGSARDRPAADRVARVAAGRLRGHRAAARRGRGGGAGRRRATAPG